MVYSETEFWLTDPENVTEYFEQVKSVLDQWFSNFLHQVPPQKIFGFPSTTIMTNIKMQYKWLPTAPGVCLRCVCVFTAVCVCTLDGLNAEHTFRVCHVTFT